MNSVAIALVLVQLMITPEIQIVRNDATLAGFGLIDTITGIGLPYMASAFGIFLLRQAFKSVPKELEDAARLEGCGHLGLLWRVYVPLGRPVYLAYGLVSVSHHWNNFLWPLVVTNSVETRPLTVGLGVFGAPESGVDWPIISAATLLSVAPLLVAFLLFQRQFVQSFMTAGIKQAPARSGVEDRMTVGCQTARFTFRAPHSFPRHPSTRKTANATAQSNPNTECRASSTSLQIS